jgi:hypothetical protein
MRILEAMRLLTSLFIASLALTSFAGIKLPSKVYQIGDLEKAKAEALVKRKPLAVLYTDVDSTCGLCNAASDTMIRELGTKTVMVYVKSLNQLPRNTWSTFQQGRFIPKIAVFDATLEKPLGMVTYEAVREDNRKAFKDIEKAIRAYSK